MTEKKEANEEVLEKARFEALLEEANAAYEAAEAKDPEPRTSRQIYYYLLAQVADQLSRALEEEGLSHAALAEKVGVSRAWVNRIMNETGNFKLETLAKLAAGLDRDIVFRLVRRDEAVQIVSANVPKPTAMKGLEAAARILPEIISSPRQVLAPIWDLDQEGTDDEKVAMTA